MRAESGSPPQNQKRKNHEETQTPTPGSTIHTKKPPPKLSAGSILARCCAIPTFPRLITSMRTVQISILIFQIAHIETMSIPKGRFFRKIQKFKSSQFYSSYPSLIQSTSPIPSIPFALLCIGQRSPSMLDRLPSRSPFEQKFQNIYNSFWLD